MYYILVDSRGDVYKTYLKWFDMHKRKQKKFKLIVIPNLKLDMIALEPTEDFKDETFDQQWFKDNFTLEEKRIEFVYLLFIEFCLTDLVAKINDGHLRRELSGDPEGDYTSYGYNLGVLNIGVITAETYTPDMYGRLIGVMRDHPGMLLSCKGTKLTAIDRSIKWIEKAPPSSIQRFISTKNANSKLDSFILSMSGIVKGLSPKQAAYLTEEWTYDITEEKVQEILDQAYYLESGRMIKHQALAKKVMGRYLSTWGRNRDGFHSKIILKPEWTEEKQSEAIKENNLREKVVPKKKVVTKKKVVRKKVAGNRRFL